MEKWDLDSHTWNVYLYLFISYKFTSRNKSLNTSLNAKLFALRLVGWAPRRYRSRLCVSVTFLFSVLIESPFPSPISRRRDLKTFECVRQLWINPLTVTINWPARDIVCKWHNRDLETLNACKIARRLSYLSLRTRRAPFTIAERHKHRHYNVVSKNRTERQTFVARGVSLM